MLNSKKHSNLLGQFLSCEENEVLWIRTLVQGLSHGWWGELQNGWRASKAWRSTVLDRRCGSGKTIGVISALKNQARKEFSALKKLSELEIIYGISIFHCTQYFSASVIFVSDLKLSVHLIVFSARHIFPCS
jgi:hypothetical protein